ncbi:MAG: flavodoxin family protein [Coriobacteriaceae bacterium]|jgi:putative NADPH-quinone reductase|nr:flavodoxin family protein [Coriobacteriaceae bacterium]
MTRSLFIMGSPREAGRSAALAQALIRFKEWDDPDAEIALFSVAEKEFWPCTGCDCCIEGRCPFEDDLEPLYPLLDAADELTIVSPVYFAGPPAQFKAVIDRMQPYFWKWHARGHAERMKAVRPLRLFVLGEGNDPHGFSPLAISVRSAFAVAGFRLEEVFDCVGITDEAIASAARSGVAGTLWESPWAACPEGDCRTLSGAGVDG